MPAALCQSQENHAPGIWEDVPYWRGTAKRLIRINWIDIWGVQTIHRFGHQSGPGKRSGGLSTAKIHVFSARVFLDRSQKQKTHKTT